MLISCEKCTTTYELDERLLPAAGAPVQCTSCSHVFLARPPSVQAQPPRAGTAMFGAVGAAPPPEVPPPTVRTGTAMFAAVPGPSLAAESPEPSPPVRTGTAMFAAVSSPPAAVESPEPVPSVRTGTAMFAAVSSPPPAAESPEPVQPARTGTAMFAAVGTPEVAPPPETHQRTGTAMFAAIPDPKPSSPEPAQPPRSGTQMFAAPSSVASTPPPPAEPAAPAPKRTQMFALPRTEAPSTANTTIPKLTAKTTQPFGLPPIGGEATSQPPAPQASKRTQMFALPKTDAAAPASAQPPRQTQMFATGSTETQPPPAPHEPKRTQMFALPPVDTTRKQPVASAPRITTTASGKVELPPDERAPRNRREPLFVLETRSRPPWVPAATIGALLAVLAGAYFFYRAWAGGGVVSPEAELTRSTALSKLRKDDSKSRQEALGELQTLVAAHPDYLDARADWVLGLALELDDSRVFVQRLQERADAVSHDISQLRERKSPGDWQNRVNALTDELEALRAKREPLGKSLSDLDQRLTGAVRDLMARSEGANSEEASVLRALAVYNGVKGADAAIGLAQRYEKVSANDGWGAVAFAELAVNARVSERVMQQSQQRIATVRSSDSTFFRASVLGARLLLAEQQFPQAITLLQSVKTLNPNHELAQQLLDWAEVMAKSE